MTTTVTIYRKTLEQAAMDIPSSDGAEILENQKAYDENEAGYIAYVRSRLAEDGIELDVDAGDNAGRTYSVEADDLEGENLAHELMSQGPVMDFWGWYN